MMAWPRWKGKGRLPCGSSTKKRRKALMEPKGVIMNYQALKSGSDVRGIAVGEDAVLTPEVAATLGAAFVRFLAKRENRQPAQITIALGRDSRVSGPELLAATAKGILSTGAVAQDYGMCTTPSMYMAILTEGFQPTGTIMLTASHHPWRLNGLKFFTKDGGLGFHELDELLEIAAELPAPEGNDAKLVSLPFLPTYVEHLRKLVIENINPEVAKPLLGLHVVVDAGNGAGGFYAQTLESLGAWVEGSQFLEPDGRFPNHIPNPENKEAMDSLSAAVLRVGADVGVIFACGVEISAPTMQALQSCVNSGAVCFISRHLAPQRLQSLLNGPSARML
ncbi:MAG: hypothetical protein EOM58_06770, partial [Clostridia bacterium]|nr:hypothetical protein [Clostridia bacterium]